MTKCVAAVVVVPLCHLLLMAMMMTCDGEVDGDDDDGGVLQS